MLLHTLQTLPRPIPPHGCHALPPSPPPIAGVHINGYVTLPDGSREMWVARRSRSKPTWPGRLDHVAAGGQPHGLRCACCCRCRPADAAVGCGSTLDSVPTAELSVDGIPEAPPCRPPPPLLAAAAARQTWRRSARRRRASLLSWRPGPRRWAPSATHRCRCGWSVWGQCVWGGERGMVPFGLFSCINQLLAPPLACPASALTRLRMPAHPPRLECRHRGGSNATCCCATTCSCQTTLCPGRR